MELWRVEVVDAEFGRDAGFGIVWAADSGGAAEVIVEFLKNDTAYGKPYCATAEADGRRAARQTTERQPRLLLLDASGTPATPVGAS